MQISYNRSGDKLLVKLAGEIDHHTAARLREEVDRLLSARIHELILDMRRVTFMDSSGIGMLLGRYKKVHATGGRVSVCNVSGELDKIMRMAGLYKVIHRA